MATLRFTKMHGCSNDYVVVETDAHKSPDPGALARALTDRRRGAGADGLLLVGDAPQATFRMRMFNPDGSEAEMCGNGLRCAVQFARDRRGAPAKGVAQTGAGLLAYDATRGAEAIQVELGVPQGEVAGVQSLALADRSPDVVHLEVVHLEVHVVRLGNPHAVCFVDDVDAFDLARVGPQVERHAAFPDRTNFEVVQVVGEGHVRQRTWERGAGETLACGTGAGAVCVAAAASGRTHRDVRVDLAGGTLQVSWASDGRVHLTGPAVTVFDGVWLIPESA